MELSSTSFYRPGIFLTHSYIGKYAFCDCENLKYINIPASCTHIDYMAFGGECFNNTTLAKTASMTTHEKALYSTYGIYFEFESGTSESVWKYYY